MTTPSVTDIAKQVEKVDEALMNALPFIGPFIGLVPGAAVISPYLPLVGELLVALDNAAKAVAAGNPGAAVTEVLQEVIDHLTPGKPNSPTLSAAKPTSVVPPAINP